MDARLIFDEEAVNYDRVCLIYQEEMSVVIVDYLTFYLNRKTIILKSFDSQ